MKRTLAVLATLALLARAEPDPEAQFPDYDYMYPIPDPQIMSNGEPKKISSQRSHGNNMSFGTEILPVVSQGPVQYPDYSLPPEQQDPAAAGAIPMPGQYQPAPEMMEANMFPRKPTLTSDALHFSLF